MSYIVKQSQTHTWFLLLAIIVAAVVAQVGRPYLLGAERPTVPQQPSVSRSEMRKANLEGAVSGTIGIDKARGDSVSVILVNPAQ